MMNRNKELGFVRLKTIVGLLVLAAGCYTAAKVIGPYFSNSQLEDKMYEEARFAQVNNRTPEQLRNITYDEAQSHGIPLRREDIKAEVSPSGARISADYTVTIDLRVYKFDMHFHPTSTR